MVVRVMSFPKTLDKALNEIGEVARNALMFFLISLSFSEGTDSCMATESML